MNSDRRSYCRIFTHYAVRTFTFAELSLTFRSQPLSPALELVRISCTRSFQPSAPFLFLLCAFLQTSPSSFYCLLLCLKCPIIFLEFSRFNAQLLTSLSDFWSVQEFFRTARLFLLFLDQHKQLRSAFSPSGPSAGKLISGQIHLCILSTQCRTLQSDQVGRLNTHSLTKAKNLNHTGRV